MGVVAENPVAGPPTGSLTMFPVATPPTGWLLCDGAAVSRSTYADLFALVGVSFGAGNGSTTFNVPNLTNRFPLGVGTKALAASGGALGHTHAHAHTHQVNPPSTVSSGPSANTAVGFLQLTGVAPTTTHTHSVDITSFASDAASVTDTDAADPPYLAVYFIVKT